MDSASDPFLTITGPTAVGKTEISVDVAECVGAEILSADSRQVYEELNVGTAKPDPSIRERIRHHFIGERSLSDPFSAGAFADEANDRIRSILHRGQQPVIVGGSTLYLHALQYGLADIPDVDEEVRRGLESRLDEEGPEALHDELKEVDPTQAEKTDPTKTQRVIRALEVYHGTGKTLTHYHENQDEPPFTYVTIVLNRDRDQLYRRINERVERMFEAGLLEEVRNVTENRDVALDEPPLSTIGYREPIQYLKGDLGYEEMVELMKRNTRRYAKRQLTWFRRYDEYVWMDAESTTATEILQLYKRKRSAC